MNTWMPKLAVILVAALPVPSLAEIYKWTDENGRVHFGDKAQSAEGAEQLSLKITTYESVSYEAAPATADADSKRVVMYSAAWCGYCRQARNYFQQNGINYVERDIEKSQSARRAYDSIGGNGVPVILVGDKRMNGFSVPGFQGIYP